MVIVERLHVSADPFACLVLREGFSGKMVVLKQLLNQDCRGLIAGVRFGDSR